MVKIKIDSSLQFQLTQYTVSVDAEDVHASVRVNLEGRKFTTGSGSFILLDETIQCRGRFCHKELLATFHATSVVAFFRQNHDGEVTVVFKQNTIDDHGKRFAMPFAIFLKIGKFLNSEMAEALLANSATSTEQALRNEIPGSTERWYNIPGSSFWIQAYTKRQHQKTLKHLRMYDTSVKSEYVLSSRQAKKCAEIYVQELVFIVQFFET